MKQTIVSLSLGLLVCAGGALAAAPALPAFNETIGAPELSLPRQIQPEMNPSSTLVAGPSATTIRARAMTGGKSVVSRMPVIDPGGDVGRNMPVLLPDPSRNHTLLVVDPKVESVE